MAYWEERLIQPKKLPDLSQLVVQDDSNTHVELIEVLNKFGDVFSDRVDHTKLITRHLSNECNTNRASTLSLSKEKTVDNRHIVDGTNHLTVGCICNTDKKKRTEHPVFALTTDGLMTWPNRTWCSMSGLFRREWWYIIHPKVFLFKILINV